MKYPNFFIIGAPKCGTSALADYLRAHPNIFMSIPKEPSFFADDFPRIQFVKSMKDYLKLFDRQKEEHKMAGEASPSYFFSGNALDNIRSFNRNAKIIVMLRHPVDMLISYHAQLVYSLFETTRDFEKAWNLQTMRCRGQHIPSTCREPMFLQYRHVASFGTHLQRLFELFPRDQVHVILFEDFIRNTRQSYENLLDYLDVPSDHRNSFPIVNQRKSFVSPKVNRTLHLPPRLLYGVLNRFNGTPIFFALLRTHEMIKQINSRPMEKIRIDPSLKQEILMDLNEEMAHLSQLLDRDLSHWMSDDAKAECN